MTIYIDLVFLLNFCFDFILLLVVKETLKRPANFYRLLIGALSGSLSFFILFININSVGVFLSKILISLLMIITTFDYKNIKYFFHNVLYLYLASFILGGFLYVLNIEFSYKNQGLIFFHKGISINFIFLLIIAPVIFAIWFKGDKLKRRGSYYYQAEVVFTNNIRMSVNAFLDSGNQLKDPYFNYPIILMERDKVLSKLKSIKPILVPYNSLNNSGLLECIKVKSLIIEKRIIKKVLIGLSDKKINLLGVDCILNARLMEERE